MKLVHLLVLLLTLTWAYTAISLIEVRHKLRIIEGDVILHDEMLETLGDDLTIVEGKLR